MRKLVMMACLASSALACSAVRSEASVAGEPYTDDAADGHVTDGICSISDGMNSHGAGSGGIGDGGSNGLDEGWGGTKFGDGGSGIINDGGTKVIGDGGGACADGDGGSVG